MKKTNPSKLFLKFRENSHKIIFWPGIFCFFYLALKTESLKSNNLIVLIIGLALICMYLYSSQLKLSLQQKEEERKYAKQAQKKQIEKTRFDLMNKAKLQNNFNSPQKPTLFHNYAVALNLNTTYKPETYFIPNISKEPQTNPSILDQRILKKASFLMKDQGVKINFLKPPKNNSFYDSFFSSQKTKSLPTNLKFPGDFLNFN
jgi:hypothetical protein